MNPKLKDSGAELLFNTILQIHDFNECVEFFEDICTYPELKAIAQRLAVAKMLRENKRYSEIVPATGASTATISRVSRSLNYGNGAYDKLLGRLEEAKEEIIQ